MQVDVALLRLGGHSSDFLGKLLPDLVNLRSVEFNPSIWSNKLFDSDNLLLLQHGVPLSLVLGVISLCQETHQKLVTPKNPASEHILQESRQIDSSLCHVLLLIIFVTLVWFCGWNNHIWVCLDKIVLQKVKVFISSAHITSNVRHFDLETQPVRL